jgi:2TM domain
MKTCNQTTNDPYEIATRRAKAKLGFYIHATVYVFVTVLQIGINSFTTPAVMWSVFPTLGWGLGLAGHYVGVFILGEWRIKEWLVEEELYRLEELRTREP